MAATAVSLNPCPVPTLYPASSFAALQQHANPLAVETVPATLVERGRNVTLCYRTKLEKLTFNYCTFLSSARPLAKRMSFVYFLQVECKSSSTSWADPDLQLRGGQIM